MSVCQPAVTMESTHCDPKRKHRHVEGRAFHWFDSQFSFDQFDLIDQLIGRNYCDVDSSSISLISVHSKINRQHGFLSIADTIVGGGKVSSTKISKTQKKGDIWGSI